jgi:hypothetical protein
MKSRQQAPRLGDGRAKAIKSSANGTPVAAQKLFGVQGRHQAVLSVFKRLKAISKYRLERGSSSATPHHGFSPCPSESGS